MIDRISIIKNSISIKDILYHYGIAVNRAGFANCIFHKDNHPSMKVYRDCVKCFSCGIKGDVIDIVMQMQNCDLNGAIDYLDKAYCLGFKKEYTKEQKLEWVKAIKKKEAEKAEMIRKNKLKEQAIHILADKLHSIRNSIRELSVCFNDIENFEAEKWVKLNYDLEKYSYIYDIIADLKPNLDCRWCFEYSDNQEELINKILKKEIAK